MTDPRLAALLQDAFDRRVDPLQDPVVLAFLDQQPELLEDFAAATAAVRALTASPLPRATPRPRRRWPWLLAAALPLAAWLALPADDAGPLPRPDFASTGVIVYLRTSTLAAGPDLIEGPRGGGTRQVLIETVAGHRSHVRTVTCSEVAPPAPDLPLCIAHTIREEIQPCPEP